MLTKYSDLTITHLTTLGILSKIYITFQLLMLSSIQLGKT